MITNPCLDEYNEAGKIRIDFFNEFLRRFSKT